MFALFSIAALLMGFLRYRPVSSLPASMQQTCYLKPTPQENNNYSVSYTYNVPGSAGNAVVFLWPEEETMSSTAMDVSISELREQIASTLLGQDVPNERWSSSTSQNVDYFLEQGFRGDLRYQHVSWSLDALQNVFYNQGIYNNAVITVSDSNSGGLCALGGFRLSSADTASTDSNTSPSPTFTPKFVPFVYAEPSNPYNSPIPSPATSGYPPGFGTPQLPSNDGDSSSVLNQSADDTTAQIS